MGRKIADCRDFPSDNNWALLTYPWVDHAAV